MNTSEHTAMLPRLYDKYVEATANPSQPKAQALTIIDEMIRRLQAAREILVKQGLEPTKES